MSNVMFNCNQPLTEPHLAPAGLLHHGASLHPSQLLQTRLGWGQQENRTPVCAPAKLHSSGLVVQRLGTPGLASAQLPQAARVAGGPVLRGRVSFRRFRLRAGSLQLHQQQGGSVQVNLATVTSIRETQSCPSAGVLLSEGFIQSSKVLTEFQPAAFCTAWNWNLMLH